MSTESLEKQSTAETRAVLPILAMRQEIIAALQSNQVIVVAGETGSGKTTRLPLLCLEAGLVKSGRIAVTQPRRIAAISISQHVARLTGTQPGEEIGYKVRFSDQLSSSTRIVYMTDGILLAEIASDPLLRRYDVIIVDEAHERSLNIDFLLGYLRTVLRQRPELKIVIASATIDTALFSRCFSHAPVIPVSGRLYPVEIRYRPLIEMWEGESMRSYLDGVITVIREVIAKEAPGDILVFLPTAQDILETVSLLRRLPECKDSAVLPLYSRMALDEQQRIFARRRQRKIVVATNIAETSITVPDIRYVIDTGLARTLRWEPSLGTSRMPIERISRAAADQRAGRCGRVQDGVAIRLFSEQDYLSRPAFASPEIKRSNLAGIILTMHHLKLGRVERFPFLQRPSGAAIADGYRQLRELDAIDSEGKITNLGRHMAQLPVDPPIAAMMLFARRHQAVREVMIIAAGLSIIDPRLNPTELPEAYKPFPGRLAHHESDFMTFVKIWDSAYGGGRRRSYSQLLAFCKESGLSFHRMREWFDVHEQLTAIGKRIGGFHSASKPATYEAIHKSLLCGLIGNVTVRQDNGLFRSSRGHDIMIFPGSVLFKKESSWVLFHEIVETTRLYGRTAASVRPAWIEELFNGRCRYTYEEVRYDPEAGTVRANEVVTYQGLSLVKNRRVDFAGIDPAQAQATFIREALVDERLGTQVAFLHANRQVREEIAAAERKLRSRSYYAGDGELEELYRQHLPGVTGDRELHQAIRRRGGERFLHVTRQDLLAQPLPEELRRYPDELLIGSARAPLRYVDTPESVDDGVTASVSPALFKAVPLYYWEWLLPVFWQLRVHRLAQACADQGLIAEQDVDRIAAAVCTGLAVQPAPFMAVVRRNFVDSCGVKLTPEVEEVVQRAHHLWLRVNVVDAKRIIIVSVRPPIVMPEFALPAAGKRDRFWEDYCAPWERTGIQTWNFHALPPQVTIGSPGQLVGLPGVLALCPESDALSLRVFFSPAAARAAHAEAVRTLLENALAEELAWAMTGLKVPGELARRCRAFADESELQSLLSQLFQNQVLQLPDELPRDRADFAELLHAAAGRISTSVDEVLAMFGQVVAEYEACRALLKRLRTKFANSFHGAIADELDEALELYLARLFSTTTTLQFVKDLPRYLKAMQGRIEMGFYNPARYRECMARLDALRLKVRKLSTRPHADCDGYEKELKTLQLMLEEYAVTLFAPQSLKSRTMPEPKLQQHIEALSLSLDAA
jgi:ATP-dependent helicase HrpA